jgi:hypothetical protein
MRSIEEKRGRVNGAPSVLHGNDQEQEILDFVGRFVQSVMSIIGATQKRHWDVFSSFSDFSVI